MKPESTVASPQAWYANAVAHPTDRTGQTDDQRIKDITVLPPPEHLIRFFPIHGTAIETLIGDTRHRIHDIMAGSDDRLLVVIGPCSIHDPAAAMEYARRLPRFGESQIATHADGGLQPRQQQQAASETSRCRTRHCRAVGHGLAQRFWRHGGEPLASRGAKIHAGPRQRRWSGLWPKHH